MSLSYKWTDRDSHATWVAEAYRIWATGVPLDDTPGKLFLEPDELNVLADSDTLRYLAPENEMHLPALLAAVRDVSGMMTGVQRIEWNPDHPTKYRHRMVSRSMIGFPVRGAVQIAMPQPGDTLFLAVSVERAIALYDHYQYPIWAVLDKDRFTTVMLPHSVKEVELIYDDDETLEAATVAVAEFKARGPKARPTRAVEAWMEDFPGW